MAIKVELIGELTIGLQERNPKYFTLDLVHATVPQAVENFNRLRRALASGQPFDLEFRPQTFLGHGMQTRKGIIRP